MEFMVSGQPHKYMRSHCRYTMVVYNNYMQTHLPTQTCTYTVESVYYGCLETSQNCPDYQGVLIFQVSLHNDVSFGTTARCVDYAGVHIFKCPD